MRECPIGWSWEKLIWRKKWENDDHRLGKGEIRKSFFELLPSVNRVLHIFLKKQIILKPWARFMIESAPYFPRKIDNVKIMIIMIESVIFTFSKLARTEVTNGFWGSSAKQRRPVCFIRFTPCSNTIIIMCKFCSSWRRMLIIPWLLQVDANPCKPPPSTWWILNMWAEWLWCLETWVRISRVMIIIIRFDCK